jgi:hypothetical protein
MVIASAREFVYYHSSVRFFSDFALVQFIPTTDKRL